jgi:hypothetical protein
MTMTPAKPRPPEDQPRKLDAAVLLEQDTGIMVEGPFGWKEYCRECAETTIRIFPERHHRIISMFEVKTSWRVYTCTLCRERLEYVQIVRR